MTRAFFRKFHLQHKFIICTSFTVIVLMVLLGLMISRRETVLKYRNIERQGLILAETLAIPVENALIYERLGLVEKGGLIDKYVTEIFNTKDIDLIYLGILDETGRVIAHNDLSEYEKVYADPITIKALSSNAKLVQKFYDHNTGHAALDFAAPLVVNGKRWGTLKFALSLKGPDEEIQATIISVVVLTLILIAGGFGIIVLLSSRFIMPITELSKTMEKAGVDTIDVKADIRGSDEIALLGQSFNNMMDRIRESNLRLMRTHEELLQFIAAIEKTGGDSLDLKIQVKGCSEIALLCESFNKMIDRIREAGLELKRTNERLLQSEKLASIGILAAGVAHEINNPLGGMFNCLQLLEQKDKNDEFVERYHGLLKDGLRRIENIVGKLLWMSRKSDKQPRNVGIKQAVDDIYGFIEYRMRKNNIRLLQNIEEGLSVFIDPLDFQQSMINLMFNAIQSMKNGGTLVINAYRDGARVVLEMTDEGEGIDEKNIHNIFDPFFTTKSPGEGTGLGLWLTYEIVKSYNGEITVESEKGKGSTFRMALPGM